MIFRNVRSIDWCNFVKRSAESRVDMKDTMAIKGYIMLYCKSDRLMLCKEKTKIQDLVSGVKSQDDEDVVNSTKSLIRVLLRRVSGNLSI